MYSANDRQQLSECGIETEWGNTVVEEVHPLYLNVVSYIFGLWVYYLTKICTFISQ